MSRAYTKTAPGSRPAQLLLSFAKAGDSGLTAAEYQRLGISLCGDKGRQLATANQLARNSFIERRVVLTPKGKAEVARLLSERKALDDATFLETRP